MLSISWSSTRSVIIGWVIGLTAVFAATAVSINNLYGTRAQLQIYADATSTGSALYAINGRPFGLDTIGGPIVYEFGFVAAIAIPLMAIILMTRMTRREEQTGRMELLRAGTVGRTAALKSAMVLTTTAFLVMAAGMAGVLAALGLSWPGVLLYPLSLALLGITFTAAGALCAQLVASAHAATALGLGILIVSFLLRGVGDVRENALVWLTPLGWAEQTRAFGHARWWPLLLLISAAMAALVAALRLADRRDLGEGMLARRRGRPQASRTLLHSFGFSARRHRTSITGWCFVAALVGAGFGSVGDAYDTVTKDNPTLQNVVGGGSTSANAFVTLIVILIVLICIGFVISGVNSVSEEERSDRLEPLLAGALSRPEWLAGHAVALIVGVIAVATAGGLALGASNAITTGKPAQIWRLTAATFAYLPAVALVLGLSAALYGLRPKLLWISWLALVFISVVAILGDILQLPHWVQDISPMSWVGRVPLETASTLALVGSLIAALALAILALRAFEKRDIPSR